MSITAISFSWRNDTPSFVTWPSRLATAHDTPTCIVIHGGQSRLATAHDTPTCMVIHDGQFTGGVHPPKSVRPCDC